MAKQKQNWRIDIDSLATMDALHMIDAARGQCEF